VQTPAFFLQMSPLISDAQGAALLILNRNFGEFQSYIDHVRRLFGSALAHNIDRSVSRVRGDDTAKLKLAKQHALEFLRECGQQSALAEARAGADYRAAVKELAELKSRNTRGIKVPKALTRPMLGGVERFRFTANAVVR
jgi:hypothetical protein